MKVCYLYSARYVQREVTLISRFCLSHSLKLHIYDIYTRNAFVGSSFSTVYYKLTILRSFWIKSINILEKILINIYFAGSTLCLKIKELKKTTNKIDMFKETHPPTASKRWPIDSSMKRLTYKLISFLDSVKFNWQDGYLTTTSYRYWIRLK